MLSNSRLVVGQVKGKLEARDEKMQGYLSNQDLNHSAYCTSLEVETRMLTPWPSLQPPWLKAWLELSL